MKTAPLPKDFSASLTARSICCLNSFLWWTILIPFPPPPAEAFIKIGNPMFSAVFMAKSKSVISSSNPGTNGILNLETVFLAESLSPITWIATGDGPIKIKPASITF